jgi:hypothetical protein
MELYGKNNKEKRGDPLRRGKGNSKRSLRLTKKKIGRVSFEITGKRNLRCFYC